MFCYFQFLYKVKRERKVAYLNELRMITKANQSQSSKWLGFIIIRWVGTCCPRLIARIPRELFLFVITTVYFSSVKGLKKIQYSQISLFKMFYFNVDIMIVEVTHYFDLEY